MTPKAYTNIEMEYVNVEFLGNKENMYNYEE